MRPLFSACDERVVVPLVLVGVGLGELGDGPVEGIAAAEVGRDGDAVAGAGMGPGQGGGAHARVDRHRGRATWPPPPPRPSSHGAGGRSSRGRPRRRRGRWSQPRKMSLLACIRCWPCTTRSPCDRRSVRPTNPSSTDAWASLACRNSGSFVVAAEHQDDPRPGADAAHADDLAGDVDQAELLEQVAAVALQRAPVAAQHASQQARRSASRSIPSKSSSSGSDERRVADDASLARPRRG